MMEAATVGSSLRRTCCRPRSASNPNPDPGPNLLPAEVGIVRCETLGTTAQESLVRTLGLLGVDGVIVSIAIVSTVSVVVYTVGRDGVIVSVVIVSVSGESRRRRSPARGYTYYGCTSLVGVDGGKVSIAAVSIVSVIIVDVPGRSRRKRCLARGYTYYGYTYYGCTNLVGVDGGVIKLEYLTAGALEEGTVVRHEQQGEHLSRCRKYSVAVASIAAGRVPIVGIVWS